MVSRFLSNRENLNNLIQNKAAKKALPSDVIDYIFDSNDQNWEELELLNKFYSTFARIVTRSQSDSMTMSEAVHLIDNLERDLDSFLSSFYLPTSPEQKNIRLVPVLASDAD